ncbi:MAG: family 10 glycosylhydrolase [Armatimonadetes bacterium]|nr:family 10 glycosylhydrolase [Armatimonadota bacterium]
MCRMMLVSVAVLLVSAVVQAANMPGRAGCYVRFSEEIKSPRLLLKEMKAIKAAGIDFILPSGKSTSGTVNWDSKVAPPDLIANPKYMEMVVEYAHAVGLQVYPVVCVCTEGGNKVMNSLLQHNPGWALYFEGAKRGYIDVGNPDARAYELALITELVSNYDIDGLSLDYMRWENRVAYSDTGRERFLKKRGVDLAEIVSISPDVALDTEGGKKALSDVTRSAREHPVWPEWYDWRRDKLNAFMHELDRAVHKAKPGLPISSYVWGAHTYVGKYETCQDWKTWIAKGWLTWINPSGYRYTDESFMEAANGNRAAVPKTMPMYITIGVLTSHGSLATADDVKRHIAMSKEAGADGVIFFTWESLRKFLPDVSEAIKGF